MTQQTYPTLQMPETVPSYALRSQWVGIGMPPYLHVCHALFYPKQGREAHRRITHSQALYRAKIEFEEQERTRHRGGHCGGKLLHST